MRDIGIVLSEPNYSHLLRTFLESKGIPHRFIEFDEPVKTVEQAGRKVPVEKIVKSIVLIGSDQKPVLAILPAKSRVSYKKVKNFLGVRDVRLANSNEVLEYSGYPAGGVPPFNNIQLVLMDPHVLQNIESIGGGGDPNKLVELETQDIIKFLRPRVVDLTNVTV